MNAVRRVRYVFQANQGQSTAINRGVQESKGDYIKLLDADDWINPEHVAWQIAALNGCTDVRPCEDGNHDGVSLNSIEQDGPSKARTPRRK